VHTNIPRCLRSAPFEGGIPTRADSGCIIITGRIVYCKGEWYSAKGGEGIAVKNSSSKRVAPAFPEPGDVVTIYGQADLTAYSKAERYGAAQGEKLAVKNPSSKRVAPAFPEPGDVVTICGQTGWQRFS